MTATTIKVEEPILDDLKKCLPRGKSLTAFVREILEKDLQRRKMSEAAEKYGQFLASNREEASWLQEWETADLASAPNKSRERKKG